MKLIDLLVRDLHKFGGWPDGAAECHRFVDEANIDFYDKGGNWPEDSFLKYGSFAQEAVRERKSACESESVTHEQYEVALAAAQPQWDGEGLPPVGCECEYQDSNTRKWYPVTIKYISDQLVVISGVSNILGEKQNAEIAKDIICDKPQFRPIRSEADKKRDEIMSAIDKALRECPHKDAVPEALLEAIESGNIPHIRIE
ncbi:hypothetical protein [Escherichia coli]|uniref:hypothetical protein n=1 Tax=Escherichia coli TaxID=562 RepID=UPI001365CA87|nr:hypothetical protein [Escherichia coli]MWF13649.1 hypothetical protein [Escherichia coli]